MFSQFLPMVWLRTGMIAICREMTMDGRTLAGAEGVAMRGLRSIWGVGLCLGLAGCAGTQWRMPLDPGVAVAGARPGLFAFGHRDCGGGPVSPAVPQGPTADPAPLRLARFFPRVAEPE